MVTRLKTSKKIRCKYRRNAKAKANGRWELTKFVVNIFCFMLAPSIIYTYHTYRICFICFCCLWLQSWQPVSQRVHPGFFGSFFFCTPYSTPNCNLKETHKFYNFDIALHFISNILPLTAYLQQKKFVIMKSHSLPCLRVCLHLLSASACATSTPTHTHTHNCTCS